MSHTPQQPMDCTFCHSPATVECGECLNPVCDQHATADAKCESCFNLTEDMA